MTKRKKIVVGALVTFMVAVPIALIGLNRIGVSPQFFVLGTNDYLKAPGYSLQFGGVMKYTSDWMRRAKYDPKTGTRSLDWALTDDEKSKHDDFEVAQVAFHAGDFAQAIERIEAHIKKHGEKEETLYWLALSYMRRAEQANCLAELRKKPSEEAAGDAHMEHNAMCALPLTMYHKNAEYSRTAAKLFEKLLDTYDAKNPVYRWLLNFSYMTVDAFPKEVPEKYVLKGHFFDHFYGGEKKAMEAKHSDIVLHDRAKELGIDAFDAGKGVAVEDFDNDGWLDVMAGGSYSSVRLFHNNEGKGFVEKTEEAGLSAIKGIHVMSAADFDNDGWIDLIVSQPDVETSRFALLKNDHGRFVDVTASSGLSTPEERLKNPAFVWATSWGDVDNDGDLDLFIGTVGVVNLRLGGTAWPSHLFINEGNGHFVDKTEEWGIADLVGRDFNLGSQFGDFDGDGWQDLIVASGVRGKSVLLKNDHGKRFVDTGLIKPDHPGFMTSFVDVNHDGRLDVLYCSFDFALPTISAIVFGERLDEYKFGQGVWIQTPDGKFEKKTDFFKGLMPSGSMGVSFGDLNNDGALDFYFGSGGPEPWFVYPSRMYLGETDSSGVPIASAEDISMLNGVGTIQKGHGIVFADFDNDGDQDIFMSLGGRWPADAWPARLFINDSKNENAWTKIRLAGVKNNRFGLGSMIKVVAADSAGKEIVRTYAMNAKTTFGSAPYLAHIGLANAVAIKRVEVKWPGEAPAKVYNAELRKLNVLSEDGGSEERAETMKR